MPFKETCVCEETVRFVGLYLSGEGSMTELCRSFGISRQWGYELVRRYRLEGPSGLEPRSRAPHCPARATVPEIQEAIVSVRREYPRWGPKKLRAVLMRRSPEVAWPAPSTMGEVLSRAGLIEARRRRRRSVPLSRPFAPVSEPNDLWCIDFKGWFRTADGARCDPLTLSDADSRYLLVCQAMRPVLAEVDAAVERAMRAYGLPLAMRSDNGPPFASTGAGGLTRLAVKWLKLGLRLERTDPAAPEQNGRHERLHRTLKADTADPPAASLAAQQARFDSFRALYNDERPHEALDQQTPASRWRPSPRPYPERLEEPHYDDGHAVRRVRTNGEIKWRGERLFLAEALAGEPVGIAETETGHWVVRFADQPVGLIDRQTRRLIPVAPARPGRRNGTPKQSRKTVNDVSGP